MQTGNHFDKIYQERLQPALSGLKSRQRLVLISAVITRIMELYFIMVIVCLFLGFMHMFPFDEMPGGSVSTIFSGFMYGVLGLVVLIIVNKQVKIRLGERNIQLVKNSMRVNSLTLVFTAIVLAAAWFIGTAYLNDEFGFPFFIKWTAGILSLFVLIVPYKLIKGTENKFNREYRDVFIDSTFGGDNDLVYRADMYLPQNEFEASKLFSDKEIWNYTGSDMFTRQENNFHGSYLEVKEIEKNVSAGKSETKISELFNGFLFTADFNKHFKGETFVLPDVVRAVAGPVYGEFINSLLHLHQAKLVQLEDPDFERMFSVYATDEVEARYILSTKLVERIVELKKDFYQDISISFSGNKIFIAVKTDKNILSPNIFGRLDDQAFLEKQVRAVTSLLSIPEKFDLSTKVWG